MARGKTPLPAGERRDHLLMFRMNDAEQTALRRMAGRAPMAQFIRAAVFGRVTVHPKNQPIPKK